MRKPTGRLNAARLSSTRYVRASHAFESDPFAEMDNALQPHPDETLLLGEPGDAFLHASNLWHGMAKHHA